MRECGILLPVASLPSRYGIGAFSKEAYEWIDRLKQAGQGFGRCFPLALRAMGIRPTSPFRFCRKSVFYRPGAADPGGPLTKEECDKADFGDSRRYISYDRIYRERFPLLRKAYDRWKDGLAGRGLRGKNLQRIRAAFWSRFTVWPLETSWAGNKGILLLYGFEGSFPVKSWNLWERGIRLRSRRR